VEKHGTKTDDGEERVNPLVEWLKHEVAKKEEQLRQETERRTGQEVRRQVRDAVAGAMNKIKRDHEQ